MQVPVGNPNMISFDTIVLCSCNLHREDLRWIQGSCLIQTEEMENEEQQSTKFSDEEPDQGAAAAAAAEKIFGREVPDVRELNSKAIPFHCGLSPIFGSKLTKRSVKEMDENLKISIAGTTRLLKQMTSKAKDKDIDQALSWEAVNSVFSQASILEPLRNSEVQRSDKLIKDEVNIFRLDGSPSAPVENEVQTWFANLIRDKDVLDDTRIDIDFLGKHVAQTGAGLPNWWSFLYSREYHEEQVVDIGVLRYPDTLHRYFKLYRIKLKAWSHSERFLVVQHDANGIIGELNLQCYKPRDEIINKLMPETVKQALKEAEKIFTAILK